MINSGFCLRHQRWNPASMGVRISEGFPNLQYFIHHLVLSASCSTFKYKVLCNSNRTFSSLKNRDYQAELFILRCSGGLNPWHPFSAVEFCLSLTCLSFSLMSLGLYANCKHHPSSGSEDTAVAIWVKKDLWAWQDSSNTSNISTFLIPDDTANFHNCLGKQPCRAQVILSHFCQTIPCINFKIPHILLCKINCKTLTCSLETPFQLIFGNLNDFTSKLSSCWTE